MTRSSVWLVIVGLAACQDKVPASPPAPAGKPVAAPADAAPRPPALLEADVRALVDAWVAAQNQGDFAAYERLYAAKLEGVKRARGRTWTFDRAGWMKDRERMFKHPMTVAARDIRVRVTGASAAVELIQTFAQGSFQDEGHKRLVVILEQGAPRIAREEMLRSDSATPVGLDQNVFLLAAARAVYLQSDAPMSWGGGPKVVDMGSPVLATQSVTRAPAEVVAWRDRPLALYAADGTRCDAAITRLYLQGGATVHSMTRAEWRGDGGTAPATEAQIADEMLTSPYLLGELSVPAGCTPVVAIAKGTPRFFAPSSDAELEERALAAFRKTPDYRDAQREFASSGEQGVWAPAPSVQVFGEPGGVRYVSVRANEGGGCGFFQAEMWRMWSVSPAGALTPIPISTSGTWIPDAVFDSDGDGQIELVGKGTGTTGWDTFETLFAMQGGELTPTVQVSYAFNDCGC